MQNLNQFQEAFETYLDNNRFVSEPKTLYEPANYILSLGGKRLRPALLLVGHSLFENDYQRSLPAAMAIEVFHNFSLVHDDIMDAAPLRRGNPTVHQQYNINTGILSGDAMLVKSFEFLLMTDTSKIVELMRVFTKMALEVCEGQQMDMDFETSTNVSITDYLRMIELKTAVLVGSAIQMGALIGGATATEAQRLYDFGCNLGIAFQLQDDLLDAFGDPKKFGKNPGGDILQKKKTFLYLKSLDLADDKLSSEINEIYNSDLVDGKEKIHKVLSIFGQLKISEHTEQKKEEYWNRALQALEGVGAVNPENKRRLKDFAVTLMNRDF